MPRADPGDHFKVAISNHKFKAVRLFHWKFSLIKDYWRPTEDFWLQHRFHESFCSTQKWSAQIRKRNMVWIVTTWMDSASYPLCTPEKAAVTFCNFFLICGLQYLFFSCLFFHRWHVCDRWVCHLGLFQRKWFWSSTFRLPRCRPQFYLAVLPIGLVVKINLVKGLKNGTFFARKSWREPRENQENVGTSVIVFLLCFCFRLVKHRKFRYR